MLTASSGTQPSWESVALQNGVFSEYLLEALNTQAADTLDTNGWISGEEAYDYLYPLVDSFTGGAQNPQIDDDIAGHVDLTRP